MCIRDRNCEKLAYEYGNQQIDQEHLLYALLTLEDSLILKLVTKMGIQGDMLKNEVKQALEKPVSYTHLRLTPPLPSR